MWNSLLRWHFKNNFQNYRSEKVWNQTKIWKLPSLCDYYIHKTDLADLSCFIEIWKFLRQISKESFTWRIREFTTWAKRIPCVLAIFPNSLCFPWQGILLGYFPRFPCAVGTLFCTRQRSQTPRKGTRQLNVLTMNLLTISLRCSTLCGLVLLFGGDRTSQKT